MITAFLAFVAVAAVLLLFVAICVGVRLAERLIERKTPASALGRKIDSLESNWRLRTRSSTSLAG